jgi:hypothetical protein
MQLGQRLGEGIDPRMFVQDYSGFTRAAEIQAQGMQNLGTAIGNVAGQVGDYFKQQGEKKKLVKQSSLQIDAALQLFPDLAPSLQGVKERMRDENIPLSDRAAEAEVVANLINMGVGEMRNRSNMSLKQEQAMADAIYKQQQLGMQERRTRATEYKASQAGQPSYEIKKATITTPTGEVLEQDMPFNPKTGRFFDASKGKEIIDINAWGLGKDAYAEDMPPTSQINYDQLPSSNNFGFTSKTRDQMPRSTADARQVSLDFNAAASKDAKGVEIIIPNDASAIERAAAMDYVNKTQQYFAERGVNVPVRGVRTAKENGRGTPGRFHTEPFFVGHAEARKVMESDPDGYAKVLADTLGRIPNVTFIAPHKTNDPGASDGNFNERDFAKGSIIPALERLSRGDLSRQAMGTPEQQAGVSRMIEQSAGMRTAQAAPSGAMPTEPRMAQPQPAAQQAPQYQVRPGFVPVSGAKQQKAVKIVKGQEAEAFGLDPMGTYKVQMNPDGSLADAQVMSAPPTAEQKQKTELAQRDMQQQVAVTKDKSERFVSMLNELKGHEGFSGLFGATITPTWVPGTDAADAKVLFDQVEAMGFMEAIKDMKGMGALSDAEGARASAAFVGIKPQMSEKAAKARIDEVIQYIQKGQERITGNKLINPDGSPQTAQDKAAVEANNYFRSFK